MNYAFMSFSCPQATFAEMLALAAQYGYDGIEPRAAGGHKHAVELEASAEQRAAFRAQAADAGIDICCLAAGNRFADPADRDAQVAESLQYIDLAADIGAPTLRVFGGRIPDGIGRESAISSVTDALTRLADRADARGVVVCLETHDDWCSPANVAAVMERVDHSAIGVNWDAAHPLRQEGWTLADSYDTLRRWIHHVHMHDVFTASGTARTIRPSARGMSITSRCWSCYAAAATRGISAANGSTGSRRRFTCRVRSQRCAAMSARCLNCSSWSFLFSVSSFQVATKPYTAPVWTRPSVTPPFGLSHRVFVGSRHLG